MKRPIPTLLLSLVLAAASACTTQPVRRDLSPDDLVARLETSDAPQREAIARDAWRAGPDAIPALAGPLASGDPALRRNALLAVETIAHHACAPGGPSERSRTSGALVALLEAPIAADAKVEVTQLLGALADDRASVRALSDRLADPQLAEAALFALGRCGHPDAGRALVDALGRGDLAVSREAIVHALGGRRERAAAGELVTLATRGRPEEARAARQALARIGDPRAEPVLTEAWRAEEPGAVADLLRYAQARLQAGEPDEALRLVTPLASSPRVHERAAAARILGGAEEQDALPALLGALSDPSGEVRAVAREELVASTSSRAGGELEHAMDSAQDAQTRAECLRVIVARRDRSAAERLKAATSDTSPLLRLTALELAADLVDPALEPSVLRGAGSIDAEERAVARRSLLVYADRHRAAREKPRALELYHSLLQGGDEDDATRGALAGVALMGDPASLEHVRALAGRPGLAGDVDHARVALAAELAESDRAAALAELDAICVGSRSRAARAEAAAQLRELGVDTGDYARRQGFLPSWYVCGPLDSQAIGTHPFGPDGPTFPEGEPEQVSAGPGLPAWVRVDSTDLDGVIDLAALLDPDTNVCAYAMWEVRVGAPAVDALLKLGSDDGVCVWLNGERVHLNDVSRGLNVDEDQVELRLREGSNLLLVQVTQGGGGWALCARLCKPDGEPIDLTD